MFTPRQERSLDNLVSEFLSDSAPPPPEATDQDSAMSDPQGWVAALGRLARRRAWSTLVDVAGTMLVVHRGGGAPDLTAEQVSEKTCNAVSSGQCGSCSCFVKRAVTKLLREF